VPAIKPVAVTSKSSCESVENNIIGNNTQNVEHINFYRNETKNKIKKL
jgi:hypothetical protein